MVIRRKKKNIQYNYDFNAEKEYYIYRFACGLKMKKKEQLLIGENKFNTYEEWAEYVRAKYSHITTGSLERFLRYLRYLLRSSLKIEISYSTVLIPLTIVFITIYMEKYIIDLKYGICGFFIVIGWLFRLLLNSFIKDSKMSILYEDYIEVIEGMLERKKKSENVEN